MIDSKGFRRVRRDRYEENQPVVDNSGTGKKCEVGNGDPNLRSQPRLPGSVVGETSMRQDREADKITRVIVL